MNAEIDSAPTETEVKWHDRPGKIQVSLHRNSFRHHCGRFGVRRFPDIDRALGCSRAPSRNEELMSNFGEGIIRETIQKLGDTLGFQMQIPDDTITNLGAVLQAQIGLLAELQSTGHLIPAGGMALTAEQVEDVRTAVWYTGAGLSCAPMAEIHRLRALFPATEPAEERLARNPETLARIKSALASTEGDTEISEPTEPATPSADGDCFEVCVGHPVEDLIEKSSLGTESAQAAIDTVSPEHGRRVARMAAQRGKVDEPRITSEGGKRWHLTETEYVEFDAAGDIWINMGPHIKDARKAAAALLAAAEAEDDAMEAAMQGEYPPAPAEPAEEETKAVTFDEIAQSLKRIGDAESSFGFNLRFWRRIAEKLIAKYPHLASSPVVPAPTETGPWQRIEDVPANVTVLDCDGLSWSYVDSHWRCHEDVDGPYSLRLINDLAPFVAAEEG